MFIHSYEINLPSLSQRLKENSFENVTNSFSKHDVELFCNFLDNLIREGHEAKEFNEMQELLNEFTNVHEDQLSKGFSLAEFSKMVFRAKYILEDYKPESDFQLEPSELAFLEEEVSRNGMDPNDVSKTAFYSRLFGLSVIEDYSLWKTSTMHGDIANAALLGYSDVTNPNTLAGINNRKKALSKFPPFHREQDFPHDGPKSIPLQRWIRLPALNLPYDASKGYAAYDQNLNKLKSAFIKNIGELLQPGFIGIIDPGFMSCSYYNKHVLKGGEFGDDNHEYNVKLIIHPKEGSKTSFGKLLTPVSKYGTGEGEVLFPPGMIFKVRSVKDYEVTAYDYRIKADQKVQKYTIELEEVGKVDDHREFLSQPLWYGDNLIWTLDDKGRVIPNGNQRPNSPFEAMALRLSKS